MKNRQKWTHYIYISILQSSIKTDENKAMAMTLNISILQSSIKTSEAYYDIFVWFYFNSTKFD